MRSRNNSSWKQIQKEINSATALALVGAQSLPTISATTNTTSQPTPSEDSHPIPWGLCVMIVMLGICIPLTLITCLSYFISRSNARDRANTEVDGLENYGGTSHWHKLRFLPSQSTYGTSENTQEHFAAIHYYKP